MSRMQVPCDINQPESILSDDDITTSYMNYIESLPFADSENNVWRNATLSISAAAKGALKNGAESPLSTVAPASKVESGNEAPFSSYCLREFKLSRSEASHQSADEANSLSVSRRIRKRPASRR